MLTRDEQNLWGLLIKPWKSKLHRTKVNCTVNWIICGIFCLLGRLMRLLTKLKNRDKAYKVVVASRNLLHFKLKLMTNNWKYVLTGDGCQLMRCCFFSPFDFELYPSNILQENLNYECSFLNMPNSATEGVRSKCSSYFLGLLLKRTKFIYWSWSH